MNVEFYHEDCDFTLPHPERIATWMDAAVCAEGCRGGEVSVIFCSDAYLLKMNREYLHHDYYTDIITFDYCETEEFFDFGKEETVTEPQEERTISGDLFISIDTVRSNAAIYEVPFERELERVMIHGILHLIGYNDKTEGEQAEMRRKEEEYLNKL